MQSDSVLYIDEEPVAIFCCDMYLNSLIFLSHEIAKSKRDTYRPRSHGHT